MFRAAPDFIEFAIAALLVALVLVWPRVEPVFRRLAARSVWCVVLVALLPVVMRLALLPKYPVPVPSGADDFSYLLLGDTLAHFRLINPVHPMHRFFEAVFVLQEPGYGSIYPIGQGVALAIGQLVFGEPWVGVLLSVAAFCGACYWMLRGWVSAEWALAGGLLAVCEFGPLCQWMNIYWGGTVSATAGCLVFGALPRRNWVLLGIGLAIQLLTRPFEFLLMLLAVIAYNNRPRFPQLTAAAAILLLAFGITALQNKQVTGSWTTLPYQLSRFQYGVPATFTFQPNPEPHRALTAEQRLDYEAQSAIHGDGNDTPSAYFERLAGRVRFYRFFFLAPLYLAIPAFGFRYPWVLATIAIFALGTNFYPYFYPHYIAAETCLFVLVAVVGLERIGQLAARIILLLCAAQFLFWYGTASPEPGDRALINARLAKAPGQQLVFVRYSPAHKFDEWIHNAADIDAARIVWAADLGERENNQLRSYYPHRAAWLVEPDARPVRLSPLQ